jgi:predicted CopG family antitoxin
MDFKHSITLDIPSDVYKYIENNHGKLSYSDFIENIIRERMKAKLCTLETDSLHKKC